jgi:hypothetical protein
MAAGLITFGFTFERLIVGWLDWWVRREQLD